MINKNKHEMIKRIIFTATGTTPPPPSDSTTQSEDDAGDLNSLLGADHITSLADQIYTGILNNSSWALKGALEVAPVTVKKTITDQIGAIKIDTLKNMIPENVQSEMTVDNLSYLSCGICAASSPSIGLKTKNIEDYMEAYIQDGIIEKMKCEMNKKIKDGLDQGKDLINEKTDTIKGLAGEYSQYIMIGAIIVLIILGIYIYYFNKKL